MSDNLREAKGIVFASIAGLGVWAAIIATIWWLA